MSKTLIGDACADMGKAPGADKRKYIRIGTVFRDDTYGSLSIKIDTLPLPGTGWEGWINVFERQPAESAKRAAPRALGEEDIPF